MPGKPYTAAGWLRIYAEHLDVHARQILRNVEEFGKAERRENAPAAS